LSRVAAFLLGQEIDVIAVTSNFNVAEFKADLLEIFKKATKPPGTKRLLLVTDTQLSNEEILISINDILNSGIVPGLDLDGHLSTLKNEAKSLGYGENIKAYFIDKLRTNMHICLCMSPVGENLRIKARKFPGLINATQIDWFHGWPKEALQDVAKTFLRDVEFPTNELRESIALNIAETHSIIDEANDRYRRVERRFNYTTPKSFLELIDFYTNLLTKKRKEINTEIGALSNGLNTLEAIQGSVNELKVKLAEISKEVAVASEITNALIDKVNADKAVAEVEEAIATEEETKTNELARKAAIIANNAEEKYKVAKPLLEQAEKAVDTVTADDITQMKSYPKPHMSVILTGKIVYFLLKKDKIDINKVEPNDPEWNKIKNMMAKPKNFI
jgi:dynein heavy chain, axonemal